MILGILEATLLSIVTLMVAWSGYSAAAWDGHASLALAESTQASTDASRADLDAREERNFDALTFEAWFTAYVAGNQQAMKLAAHRFGPDLGKAFTAWLATDPTTNPDAPRGPTDMPEYQPPEAAKVAEYDSAANVAYDAAVVANDNSDGYVRTTVFLASVLFLIGISTRFPSRGGRYGLIVLGCLLLVFSSIQLLRLPGLPT